MKGKGKSWIRQSDKKRLRRHAREDQAKLDKLDADHQRRLAEIRAEANKQQPLLPLLGGLLWNLLKLLFFVSLLGAMFGVIGLVFWLLLR